MTDAATAVFDAWIGTLERDTDGLDRADLYDRGPTVTMTAGDAYEIEFALDPHSELSAEIGDETRCEFLMVERDRSGNHVPDVTKKTSGDPKNPITADDTGPTPTVTIAFGHGETEGYAITPSPRPTVFNYTLLVCPRGATVSTAACAGTIEIYQS